VTLFGFSYIYDTRKVFVSRLFGFPEILAAGLMHK